MRNMKRIKGDIKRIHKVKIKRIIRRIVKKKKKRIRRDRYRNIKRITRSKDIRKKN